MPFHFLQVVQRCEKCVDSRPVVSLVKLIKPKIVKVSKEVKKVDKQLSTQRDAVPILDGRVVEA